jgi:hypothetical protein
MWTLIRLTYSFAVSSPAIPSMLGHLRYSQLPEVGVGWGGGKVVEDEEKQKEKQKQEKKTLDYQVLCLLLLCKLAL